MLSVSILYANAFLEKLYFEKHYMQLLIHANRTNAEDLLYQGMAELALFNIKRAENKLSKALLLFHKEENAFGIGRCHLYLGALAVLCGHAQKAKTMLMQATKWLKTQPEANQLYQAELLFYKALFLMGGTKHAQAKRLFKKASLLYRHTSFSHEAHKVLCCLAQTYFNKGQYEQAHRLLIRVAENTKETAYLTRSLCGLGSIAVCRHETTKAKAYFDRAFSLAQRISSYKDICYAHCGFGDLYFLKGHQREAIHAYKKALSLSKKVPCLKLKAHLFRQLGEAYRMCDQVEKARACFTKSLSFAKSANSIHGQGYALLGLADVARITDNHFDAQCLYTKALHFFERSSCVRGKAHALRGQGTLFVMLGHYEKAKEALQNSLTLCKETADLLTESRVYIWQGKLAMLSARYGRARTFFEKGLCLCRRIKDLWGEVQILTYLGNLEQETNQIDRAEILYRKTYLLACKIKDRAKEAMAHLGLGAVNCARGKRDNASTHFEHALKIFQYIQNVSGVAQTLYENARCMTSAGHSSHAMDLYAKAYMLVQGGKNTRLEMAIWREMGALEKAQGNMPASLIAYKTALTLAQKTNNTKEQAKTHLAWAKAYKISHPQDSRAHALKAMTLFKTLDSALYVERCEKMLS